MATFEANPHFDEVTVARNLTDIVTFRAMIVLLRDMNVDTEKKEVLEKIIFEFQGIRDNLDKYLIGFKNGKHCNFSGMRGSTSIKKLAGGLVRKFWYQN